MATLKLRTNVPVEGTLKYCDVAVGERGTDLRLKGEWTDSDQPPTASYVYIPLDCLKELILQGGVEATAKQGENGDYHKVLKRGPWKILKAEDGRTKRTTITLLGAATPAQGDSAPATPARPGLEHVSLPVYWERQDALMQHCLERAVEIHARVDNEYHAGLSAPECINTTAHSLYIQANRDLVSAPPSRSKPVTPAAPAIRAAAEKHGQAGIYEESTADGAELAHRGQAHEDIPLPEPPAEAVPAAPAAPAARTTAAASTSTEAPYAPSDKQVQFFKNLINSSVFTAEEKQRGLEWLETKATRQTINDQLDWLKRQLETRKRGRSAA